MKRLRSILLILSVCPAWFCLPASSQDICGFDKQHHSLLEKDPLYKNAFLTGQKKLRKYLQTPQSKVTATVYHIPVVVHVIHKGEAIGTGTNISDAQIQSAVTSLTQFYRGTIGNSVDAEIEFELASLDPNCDPTTGIVRVDGTGVTGYTANGLTFGSFAGTINETMVKNLSRWPNTDYYNIWIVSEINNNNAGAGVQGFAYFPGAAPTVDGAVMLYNTFGYDPTAVLGYNLKSYTNENKVVTHELGHAFGLYHTFQGDDANNDGVADQCPSNGDCTAEGDEVCDTDPHWRSVSNCPSPPNGGCGAANTIVNNYMDYSSEGCQDRFTAEQVDRMRAVIEILRPSLTTSLGRSTTYPLSPYTAPGAASCTPATSGTGLGGNYAGIMNVNINNRNFSSSTAAADNGYVNGTSSCLNLLELVRGATYTFTATVLGFNAEQIRAWIDFDNSGTFSNVNEEVYINSSIPITYGATVSGNFTVPAGATVNTVLRMRVIDDLIPGYPGTSPISTACYNPVYGQAEDYPVYLYAALPVNLEYFKAEKKVNDVLLSWKTAMEQNAREFVVERSTDGNLFTGIASIPASNEKNGKSYVYTDKSNTFSISYYRLKQIDKDGSFTLSRVIVIKNTPTARKLQVIQNPFTDKIELIMGQSFTGKSTVSLFELSGRKIASANFLVSPGNKIVFDVSGYSLPKGLYLLQVETAGERMTEKLIKK